MHRWPLAAAILLAIVPAASASGGSSVDLAGETRLDASAPVSTEIAIVLVIDGVVCAGEADVPVHLRITDIQGMRSAALSWESVLFRIAGHQAATQPFRGESAVALRLWANEPAGSVTVAASYALPPHCRAFGGATSGEATHTLAIDGPAPPPAPPQPMPQAPPAAPKSESLLAPPPAGKEIVTLPRPPMPVLGAVLGMVGGGGVVFWKRLRALVP